VWGIEVSHDAAMQTARETIRKIEFWRAVPRWLAVGAAVIVAIALIWANAAKAD
jgi:hypothetical protein